MNKFVLWVCLLFSSSVVTAHDVPIAIFKIYEVDGSLSIDIKFDLKDFCESYNIKKEDINLNTLDLYLNGHTKFIFDGDGTDLKVTNFTIVKDHLSLKALFSSSIINPTSIKIESDFLVDIPNQSNVITLHLHEKERDFRMHKKRTRVEVDY